MSTIDRLIQKANNLYNQSQDRVNIALGNALITVENADQPITVTIGHQSVTIPARTAAKPQRDETYSKGVRVRIEPDNGLVGIRFDSISLSANVKHSLKTHGFSRSKGNRVWWIARKSPQSVNFAYSLQEMAIDRLV